MAYRDLGDYINRRRDGKSLREFAAQLGISHTHLDSIEKGCDPRTGKTVSITIDTLSKIAAGLNVDMEYPVGILEATGGVISPTEDIPLPPRKKKAKIPVLGSVQAGLPTTAVEDIISEEEITEELARTGIFSDSLSVETACPQT